MYESCFRNRHISNWNVRNAGIEDQVAKIDRDRGRVGKREVAHYIRSICFWRGKHLNGVKGKSLQLVQASYGDGLIDLDWAFDGSQVQSGLSTEADLASDIVAKHTLGYSVSSAVQALIYVFLQGLGEPFCDFCVIEHWSGLIDRDGCRALEISPSQGHFCVWIISRREFVIDIEFHGIHSSTHTSGNFEQSLKIERELGFGFCANFGVEEWQVLLIDNILNDGGNHLGKSRVSQYF